MVSCTAFYCYTQGFQFRMVCWPVSHLTYSPKLWERDRDRVSRVDRGEIQHRHNRMRRYRDKDCEIEARQGLRNRGETRIAK